MDNPAAPISSTSLQLEVSPTESPNRRWLLWLIGGAVLLGLGIVLGLFSAKLLNQSSTQPPGNFFPIPESVIPTFNPDAKEPEKCFTAVGPCIPKGCDYNPQQCAVSSQNACSVDQDCGLNICDCLALPREAIAENDKVCTRYCPGIPRCIDNRCQLVDENK